MARADFVKWTARNAATVGNASSAQVAAASDGRSRHVLTLLSFTFSASTALAGVSTVTVNLIDGDKGDAVAGDILWSWQFSLPAATIPSVSVSLADLYIPGSPGKPMTLEFAAGVGNLITACNMAGYDA